MKKLTLSILVSIGTIIGANAQCCNVVSSNGISAITANGICAITASGLGGDCGKAEEVIDTDADGVPDDLDSCPTVFGTLLGCPDIDGDSIADKDDACPSVFGTLLGCPDTDGDGIADKDDACPKIAGLAVFSGCMDTDGDGIADPKDACPTVAGVASLGGCPDGDADGVADKDDKCPEEAGLVENKGCPAVEEEELEILEEAINGVKFQSGKDIITKASFPILDNVVKVLTNKPAYKLSIEGHTDSQGDDAMNLELSKKRAAAVKAYLEEKGIDSERLTSEGFGETVPVGDNNTATGRAENRRVELKVNF